MAVVVIEEAEVTETDAGLGVLLTYLLPDVDDETRDNPNYGGHQQFVPFVAVWQRMAQYGLDRGDALEECVVETVASDVLRGWPNSDDARAEARHRHDTSAVRDFGALVPEPTDEQTAQMRRVLRLDVAATEVPDA